MTMRSQQVDIRRALALSGTFSFLCSCSRFCLLPFLTLFLRQLGLNPAMTGIVLGTKHLVTLLWSPASGLLARRYDKRRAAIAGSLVGSAAVALVLLLVPSTGVQRQTASCNTSGLGAGLTQSPRVDGVKPTTLTNRTLQSQLWHQNSSLVEPNPHGSPVRKRRSDKEPGLEFLGSLKVMDSQHQLFFLVLIIVSLWEFVSAPLEWTADDGLYEYLDFADASDRYGSTASWGLLGAACGVGGAGLLVSQLSCLIAGGTPRSAAHFYCSAGVAVLVLPVVAHLPLYLSRKRSRANGLLKAVQLVRGSPRALLCAVTVLLVGVAGSAADDFLLWQIQNLGGSELHMGSCLALALLSQAAFPLLSARLARLLSPGRVLAVGAASLGLQCFYYSFLWGPWAALPAQVLSCLGGGALWWAVKVQSEDVATPGAEQSVRRVYGVLCLRLGAALGSYGGGQVAQRFGLPWLFRGAAILLMLWCACLPLLQVRAPRLRSINYSRLLTAEASEASDSGSDQERDWLDKAMEDDRSNNNYGRANRWDH